MVCLSRLVTEIVHDSINLLKFFVTHLVFFGKCFSALEFFRNYWMPLHFKRELCSTSGRHRYHSIATCPIHSPVMYISDLPLSVGSLYKHLVLIQSAYNHAEPCTLSATLLPAFRNVTPSSCASSCIRIHFFHVFRWIS